MGLGLRLMNGATTFYSSAMHTSRPLWQPMAGCSYPKCSFPDGEFLSGR